MKNFICLMLTIYLAFSLKIDRSKTIKEIKLKKKLIGEENQLKQIYQGALPENYTIEFDEDYIITQISWTKKDNYKYNYLLGIFEGSNDKSFLNGIPIGIIKEKDGLNEINYLDIISPNSFKYIRYIPPNKNNTNFGQIQIFGYLKSESNYLNEEKYLQVTNLPLVSINTENSNEPSRWVGDINCTITIINEGKIENSENGVIKVRGRTTSILSSKKPYRIKFSTKQKILNFKGKEKKWTLIANHFDRSLLRNNLAFKISELIGLKYTPRCLPVDVILNGNFRGNYYICDKIEIGKNRINITKMEKTDINEPNITGGYLLQIDSLSKLYPNGFELSKGLIGLILYPEDDEITEEQKSYITYRLNKFEDEIYNGILDSIDLDSYSRYFIMEEFSGDIDHLWSSFYFTKERHDDKFYFGPAWDFDLAFDNEKRLIPTNNKTEFCFNYGDSAGTMRQLVEALIGNKIVIENIKKTWEKLCETVLNDKILVDFLNEEKMKIKESAELNFLKWDNFVEEPDPGMPFIIDFGRKGEDFDFSVEVVKDYVKDRFKSLTNLINDAILRAK